MSVAGRIIDSSSTTALEGVWTVDNAQEQVDNLVERINELLNITKIGGFATNVAKTPLGQWNHETNYESLKAELDSIGAELITWSSYHSDVFYTDISGCCFLKVTIIDHDDATDKYNEIKDLFNVVEYNYFEKLEVGSANS